MLAYDFICEYLYLFTVFVISTLTKEQAMLKYHESCIPANSDYLLDFLQGSYHNAPLHKKTITHF